MFVKDAIWWHLADDIQTKKKRETPGLTEWSQKHELYHHMFVVNASSAWPRAALSQFLYLQRYITSQSRGGTSGTTSPSSKLCGRRERKTPKTLKTEFIYFYIYIKGLCYVRWWSPNMFVPPKLCFNIRNISAGSSVVLDAPGQFYISMSPCCCCSWNIIINAKNG